MIMDFLTNATGTMVPVLLACAITYILLMTITERSLSYRHLFIALLITWLMSTVTGYLIEARNFLYVAIAFAVLGTFLLLRGIKDKDKPDESE